MLITGGAGFLGSATAQAAHAAGFDVHVTWRRRRPEPRLPAHRIELTDPSAVQDLLDRTQPNVIVNATGGTHRPVTRVARLESWRDCATATVTLLEAISTRPVRMVHIASSHEYAPSDRPLRETDRLWPVSHRGAAKLAALVAVRQWAAESGGDSVIVRPFSVYGPGEPPDRLVPAALTAAITGIEFRLPEIETRRDLVHVDDVVAGIMVAACADDATSTEINLCTGYDVTAREVVAVAEEVTGLSVRLGDSPFPLRPGDRDRWAGDSSVARRILGWVPRISLRDGMAEYARVLA